jgi:hypothetical protein
MLHETLYRAALARGVASLEEHHDAAAGILDPVLQFEQFDLEQPFLVLIFVASEPFSVGIVVHDDSCRQYRRALARPQ